MRTLLWTFALLLSTGAPALFGQTIRVPLGKPVMIDGNMDAGGWEDSVVTEFPGLATIYMKRSNEYVWLALKLNSNDGAVDLYLSPPDGSIYRLARFSQARRAPASERCMAGLDVVEQCRMGRQRFQS